MNWTAPFSLILRIAVVAFFAIVIQVAMVSQISLFGVTAPTSRRWW